MVTSVEILKAGILIVDDNETNVRLLERMLRGAGYSSVESTTDPKAVCELYRRNRYGLILLDLHMPGMDGFQVMEGLKEIEGDGYLPVLVITAQSGHKLRALGAGAKDFVGMPFDMAELRARVHNILEVRLLHMEASTRNEALEERNAQLKLRNREIMLLGSMGERLQACASEAEAQRILIRFARDLCPALSGALSMIGASRNLAARTVSWGKFPLEDCCALLAGRTHVCVPVMANGETFGGLHLVRLDGEDLDRSQLRMAAIMAERMALAVANIRLREELKALSIRDPLTGLFNRRFMEESLDRELQRANRDQSTIGAIMLDIDHFKLFNDTFGHDGGDAVLKEFGAVLEAETRAEDIVCRYGGEEFLIFMPGASLDDTRRRADSLLESIRNMAVVSRGRKLGPVSASMGVAVYPKHGAGMASLIAAADDALYQAKTRGRDRFMMAAGHPIHSGVALEAVPSPA